MIRNLLPLSLLLLPALCPARDTRGMLVKRYEELNTLILRQDAGAAEVWVKRYVARKFLFTSKDKRKYDAKGFLQGLRDQMKLTKQVESSRVGVGTPVISGKKLTVTVTSDFKGIVRFDNRDLTLTDKGESQDVWVRVGSDWKLLSIRQTRADTQMFGRD